MNLPALSKPIRSSRAAMALFRALFREGVHWHPDEDPSVVVDDAGRKTFTRPQQAALRARRREIEALGLDPSASALEAYEAEFG